MEGRGEGTYSSARLDHIESSLEVLQRLVPIVASKDNGDDGANPARERGTATDQLGLPAQGRRECTS